MKRPIDIRAVPCSLPITHEWLEALFANAITTGGDFYEDGENYTLIYDGQALGKMTVSDEPIHIKHDRPSR